MPFVDGILMCHGRDVVGKRKKDTEVRGEGGQADAGIIFILGKT
jgi:hypothetical protein